MDSVETRKKGKGGILQKTEEAVAAARPVHPHADLYTDFQLQSHVGLDHRFSGLQAEAGNLREQIRRLEEF